jgi:hypothetical protein
MTSVPTLRFFGTKVGDAVPINFKKSGEDPKLKPSDTYPSWLWTLDQPTMGELKSKGLEHLTVSESRRFYQLKSTEKIKEKNQEL